MKKLIVVLALGVVLVANGCSQISVQSDFDPSADFEALKTYAWYEAEQPKTGDIRIDNPILDQRVRSTVEGALNAKGYTKVAENPDFLLVYHAAVSKELEVTSGTTAYGAYGYYGWHYVAAPVWVETPTAYTYNKGTLILDIIDAKSEKLVWRGSAQAELNETSTQQQKKARMDEAVNGMLKNFPPKPTK
jgi:hypothetical protein